MFEEQMGEMIMKNNDLSQIVKLYQFNLQRISKINSEDYSIISLIFDEVTISLYFLFFR